MRATKIIGYKFIKSDMKSKEGDCLWKVGEWKHENDIELCSKGLHACRTALQSFKYVYGDKWFIVEAKGKILEEKENKFVCSDMKLVKEIPIDKVVKRFALFCAKDCLKNYEKKYPKDNRVSECIRITELYLDGKTIRLPKLVLLIITNSNKRGNGKIKKHTSGRNLNGGIFNSFGDFGIQTFERHRYPSNKNFPNN